jgi:ATP-dependent DNA helicase RecG
MTAASSAPPREGLSRPLAGLPGIGSTRADYLAELDVHTLGDLLEYFPRTYVQESPERSLADLEEGQIQWLRGTVTAVDYAQGSVPRFVATLSEGKKTVDLVFFRGRYLIGRITPGMLLLVRGKVDYFRDGPQMVNPYWKLIDANAPRVDSAVYRPVYSATRRMPSQTIAQIIGKQLKIALEEIGEWFDADFLRKRKLIGRGEAYQRIHQPADARDAIAARKQLVYDELILMQLGLQLSRRLREAKLSAPAMKIDKTLDKRIRDRFSFQLTTAQEAAAWQIAGDLKRPTPMNRLLQGDVGSGKTAVAVYAMLATVANQFQSALLAPTEALADQHYLTLQNLLAGSRVRIGLFTQRAKRRGGKKLGAALANGEIDIAVGTQALIQQDIQFAKLGLVVVDEQHRLGVRQRQSMWSKGLSPHYLVMTATPIPRTLALSYLADFELSVIDEPPPGRLPINTRLIDPSRAGEAYDFIIQQVAAGRQAYIVLPQIEDDGVETGKSVLREIDRLQKGPLSKLRLAALHGRMKTTDKQTVMTSFRDRQIDVLVATTVIEVGIDVPNATVILIDQADRFGLSQLHQLRGRVGRGAQQSFCLLLSDASNSIAAARVAELARTNSGFEIAELDLKLRGPGEFFGDRQHGLPQFKIADLEKELDLLKLTRDDAQAILSRDANLTAPSHRHLREALVAQFGQSIALAQVG